ncbi:hypothetical protein SVIOM342S_10528 [Streptomyces violaceorubidus]
MTGPAASDSYIYPHAYAAQIIVGDHDRGCSGVLVDSDWLLTAASCFAENPAESLTVPAGKPALTTTATIGRADLTGTGGAVRTVVELVPRTDRDVVLARFNRPVTNVTPVALATAAPTTGEELNAGRLRPQQDRVGSAEPAHLVSRWTPPPPPPRRSPARTVRPRAWATPVVRWCAP